MATIITDVASSPLVAVPLGIGAAAANFIALLPLLLNLAMFAYFVILVAHKIWVWYKEVKGEVEIKDTE